MAMKHLRLLICIFGVLHPGSIFSQQTPSSSPQQTPSTFFEHMRNAKEQFDKESAPQTAADFANRGSDKLQNGDYDGAIADSSKAIELDSKMPEAYYNRGTAKLQKADCDGAITDLSKAIELKLNRAEAYSNRGIAKQRKADYEGAIADFSKAIEVNPKYAEAYYNRGNAKDDKRDYEGAIADYSKAIELNANFARAYYNRGAAKKHKGDLLGALVDDNKALKLDPNLQQHSSFRQIFGAGPIIVTPIVREGSRPRPAAAGLLSKPKTCRDHGRKYTI